KLETFMCQLVVNTTINEINSICRYSYIFSDNFWVILNLKQLLNNNRDYSGVNQSSDSGAK
ncbi:MAG: hypothetical protein NTV30_00915, partial [Chloroflexi bacterium]|nr:hypothetical protein [Chloroflexota bacterium]